MRFCVVFPGFAFLFALCSCNLINPDEEIPSYLHIEKILVQGNVSNITDAWVYDGTALIGVFELPCTVPILSEGERNITVKAGIKVNGISSNRKSYSFLEYFTKKITLIPGQIYVQNSITVTYRENLTYLWVENFESSNISLFNSSASEVAIVQGFDAVEGDYSGKILLTPIENVYEGILDHSLILPKSTPVYLEMSYKNDITFEIGLRILVNNQTEIYSLMGINPSVGQWKKIYIDLAQTILQYPDAHAYKVYFRAVNTSDANKTILLDNLRLIHFTIPTEK